MPMIPIINRDVKEVWEEWQEKLKDPVRQRRLVLVIVCIALLLDNMLYMVIVPIIPVYLLGAEAPEPPPIPLLQKPATPPPGWNISWGYNWTKPKLRPLVPYNPDDDTHDASIGFLFASKAIVQLLINPLSGTIIDRLGYETPMLFGLTIIFLSTNIFAFGSNYAVLFLARSLQGVGSAFADTSGLAMIADRYQEDQERSMALGIALAFISFGCLFAPPFGGVLYEFCGKEVPFVILALVALIDGLLVYYVMKPARFERSMKLSNEEPVKGTPIHQLILDPFIACCAGGLVMANVSLAFLEPTIALWMKDSMDASEWEIGLVWLPAFFPHVGGVYLTVKLMNKFPTKVWLVVSVGLCLEGFSCLLIPFCTAYWALIIPICINCLGIAMVDTAILPVLGYLVDMRHTSVYGSVYAIADISYSLAYAFGPIVAGGIVSAIGFTSLNVIIFISNVAYAPVLYYLRNVYAYKPFEEEVMLQEAPGPGFKSYHNADGKGPQEVNEITNHLDLSMGEQPPPVYKEYTPYPPTRPPPPTNNQSSTSPPEQGQPGNPFKSTVQNGGQSGDFRPYH